MGWSWAVPGAKSRAVAGAPPRCHLVLTPLSWRNQEGHPPLTEAAGLVSLNFLSLDASPKHNIWSRDSFRIRVTLQLMNEGKKEVID